MPYFATSQEWLTQSALLLQARPSTTRITTKYKIIPPSASKPKATTTTSTPASAPPTTSAAQPPQPNTTPRATLTLKTYDPTSGVCLKYRTDKAAKVGRLISTLGRLGRGMAGLKGAMVEEVGDVVMEDVGETAPVAGEKEKVKEAPAAAGGGGGGGAKKGKGKKGKK